MAHAGGCSCCADAWVDDAVLGSEDLNSYIDIERVVCLNEAYMHPGPPNTRAVSADVAQISAHSQRLCGSAGTMVTGKLCWRRAGATSRRPSLHS